MGVRAGGRLGWVGLGKGEDGEKAGGGGGK